MMQMIGGSIAWIGASVGALTAILAALGYLVEGGYLASFGLNRGVVELPSVEYVMTGGQFLLALIPLALAGAVAFALDFWWIVLVLVVVVGVGLWLRLGAVYRWAFATAANAIWLVAVLPLLSTVQRGSEANRLVAMMTFVAVSSLLYALLELAISKEAAPRGAFAARLAFAAVLSVTLLTLPHARGRLGLARDLPVVQLPQKVAAELCGIAAADADAAACATRTWRLVQFGKERSVLLDPRDGSLYVVPATKTATLRVLSRQQEQ